MPTTEEDLLKVEKELVKLQEALKILDERLASIAKYLGVNPEND